jgi:hypothetical protein
MVIARSVKAPLALLVDLLISIMLSGTLLGGTFSASGKAFSSLTCGMLPASGEAFLSSFTGMIPATVAVECIGDFW